MFVGILKYKQYLKQNHFISIKVLKIYISLCMSNNGDVHTIESIAFSFGDTIFKKLIIKVKTSCSFLYS